jgi:hypothetical protein
MFEFVGLEQTKWYKEDIVKKEINPPGWHKGFHSIIHNTQALHTFPDRVAPAGQYSFPFVISLPEWLPASFIFYGPN